MLLGEIRKLSAAISRNRKRPLQIMEVCGGHTHSIFRYGIQQMLPDEVEFVHGPGCPVCVLPMGRVDDCVALAERPEVIFTTFGDAMRVPGSRKSLLKAKADGADVRMVYSPLDALAIARKNPDREVIFFGLGFETTMPSTAMTVIEARRAGRDEFLAVLQSHHDHSDDQGDSGFARPAPGRVPWAGACQHGDRHRAPMSSSRGTIASRSPSPGSSHWTCCMRFGWCCKQIDEGRCEVENQYGRVVPEHGNPNALAAIHEVYELREFFEWRGLGSIDHSGVRLRESYAAFDAERKFAVPNIRIADPKACQCGEVLKGVIKPRQCKVFGTACTPETPLGSLMVSSEGACAAYYNYGRTDMSLVADAAGMNVRAPIGARRGGTVRDARINMSHGSGGKAMRALIEDVFRRRVRQSHAWRVGGPGAHPARATSRGTVTGWRSPPIPMWSTRCSFRAATSARLRWRAPSTISRCAARGRCSCRAAWCWRKDWTSTSCAAWQPA